MRCRTPQDEGRLAPLQANDPLPGPTTMKPVSARLQVALLTLLRATVSISRAPADPCGEGPGYVLDCPRQA